LNDYSTDFHYDLSFGCIYSFLFSLEWVISGDINGFRKESISSEYDFSGMSPIFRMTEERKKKRNQIRVWKLIDLL